MSPNLAPTRTSGSVWFRAAVEGIADIERRRYCDFDPGGPLGDGRGAGRKIRNGGKFQRGGGRKKQRVLTARLHHQR
jgi:hypothetical protein